jgi:hypothetical protein
MMLRPCLEPGCPHLTTRTRCPGHTQARTQQRDRQRGTTTQRGYGWAHQQQRASDLAAYDPDQPCPRCGQPLGDDPSRLDLGHTPDRSGYEGLTHLACNRATNRR